MPSAAVLLFLQCLPTQFLLRASSLTATNPQTQTASPGKIYLQVPTHRNKGRVAPTHLVWGRRWHSTAQRDCLTNNSTSLSNLHSFLFFFFYILLCKSLGTGSQKSCYNFKVSNWLKISRPYVNPIHILILHLTQHLSSS